MQSEQIKSLYKELNETKESNTSMKIEIENLHSKIKKLKKLTLKPVPKICSSCEKVIKEQDLFIFKNNTYHKNCIKCKCCEKPFDLSQEIKNNFSDIVCINPSTFLCKEHYEQFHNTDELPEEIATEYKKQTKENLVQVFFDNKPFSEIEIQNVPSKDVFITDELADNSYQINKPYGLVLPTAEFHFEKKPEEIDFDESIKVIGSDYIIIKMSRGSTFLTIAFLKIKEFGDKLRGCIKERVNEFKKIISPLGQPIFGNLIDEPITTIPEIEKIQDLYDKPSINILQNTKDLDEDDLKEIQEEVLSKLPKEKNENWKFVFQHQNIFDEVEEKIKKDIRNNPFEMIVIGETVIANKYLKKYFKIKDKLPENIECYVYHGSRLNNHQKIVQKHFYMPGEDNVEQRDSGYYGKGIYATDNIFYASIYGNGYEVLSINETTSIIVCKAIYNRSEVLKIKDMTYYGKQFDSEIANNYGIHQAFVGNEKGFEPIKEEEIENNSIVANEFVFPNKYQICPILSLVVVRADHLILWKDDHVDNDENTRYVEEISRKCEINFYHVKTNEEAIEIIKLKKRNKIKLITNGGENCNSQELIESIRQIIGSNFVCLVFARSLDHREWVTKMENVLLANNPEDFKRFVALKMIANDILKFKDDLERELDFINFKINEEELLKFPPVEETIPM